MTATCTLTSIQQYRPYLTWIRHLILVLFQKEFQRNLLLFGIGIGIGIDIGVVVISWMDA